MTPSQDDCFDPRVVALTQASQKLLACAGVWEPIQAHRACAYTRMDVWDADGTGNIQFDSREVQQPCLGHIVENNLIASLLLARIKQLPNVSVLMPAKVSSILRLPEHNKTQLMLEGNRSVTGTLVIAADGARSNIRELANMPTREWDYGHSAIVTTVKTEKPHQFTAWQRFLPTGPLAFLPLQVSAEPDNEEHYSSIVWSAQTETAQRLMGLDDATFMAELSNAFEGRLGEVVHTAKRFSFPLRQRHAIDYIADGIALVGDAAHTIHPLAGQGVNLGLLDVAVLRDEIIRAQRRHLPLSDASILRRYQRGRKSDNLAMMAMMEGFKRLFGADHLPLRWLRNEGMRKLNSVPLLKNAVVKQAMGL